MTEHAKTAPSNHTSLTQRLRSFDLRRHTYLLSVVFFLILCGINIALQPSFLQPGVMVSNLSTFLPLILVSIGQTYVILASDIDLSVGSIVSLVNVATVSIIEGMGGTGGAIALGLTTGLGLGIAAGLFNGLCVALLRFQPIVTTFATGIIFAGLALWILPQAGKQVPATVWQTYGGSILGVQTVIWVLTLAVIFALVLARTRFHHALLATGGQMQSAFQTGLHVLRVRITAYALSGLFSALAALCLVGETASGDPLLGTGYTLSSISAVVLGGTALSGGIGGFIGSVFGAMILGLIDNVIFFARLPFEYQGLVQGLIVLLALAGGVFVSRR
ncbi:ABC transporter permease [Rhodospirillaceae bacterium SYSU D60014]|uniref:ABC transporter permease n=1 Tax=Virgifigura deserti TaxID=2268457 RepID=UPI000E670109